jgi:hypothetical protein
LCAGLAAAARIDHSEITARPETRRNRAHFAARTRGNFLRKHIAMGVQLILSDSDFSLLMQATTARASLVRGIEKNSQVMREDNVLYI